jgi:hypothetical protein
MTSEEENLELGNGNINPLRINASFRGVLLEVRADGKAVDGLFALQTVVVSDAIENEWRADVFDDAVVIPHDEWSQWIQYPPDRFGRPVSHQPRSLVLGRVVQSAIGGLHVQSHSEDCPADTAFPSASRCDVRSS